MRTRTIPLILAVCSTAWLLTGGPAQEAVAACQSASADVIAAPMRDNTIPTTDVLARGTDNALWHRWWAAGRGSTCWESLGGDLAAGGGIASHGTGILHLVALGSDGRIKDRSFVNENVIHGGWSNWVDLGTQQFASAPAAVSWDSNHLEVFARGTDNRIWHTWFRFGIGWSAWYPFDGGPFIEAPAAVTHMPLTLNLYALGTDGRMWERYHMGGGQWSPWQVTGEERFTSAPLAGSWSNP